MTSMEDLTMRDDREMHATIMGDKEIQKAHEALKRLETSVNASTSFDEFCNAFYANTPTIGSDKLVAWLLLVIWIKLRSR